MTQKQNRWLINGILILAVLALVGVSVLPLLSEVFKGQGNSPQASPTASGSPSAIAPGDLAAQAKGYELVLQREPDNQTALRGLVDARLQMRDFAGVISPLERLAKLNPTETRFQVLLAQTKQYTGDREGAAQIYRSILTTKPGDLNALDGLVSLLLEQQRPEAAIGLLQDTLNTASQANQIQANSVDVSSVQLLLGRVYAEQKRYDEAIAIYDQASQRTPQDFRPILAKAIILKEQGKTTEAQPLFLSASSLAPAQYKDQIKQLASASPSPRPSANATPRSTPAPTTPSPASSSSPSPAPASPSP